MPLQLVCDIRNENYLRFVERLILFVKRSVSFRNLNRRYEEIIV